MPWHGYPSSVPFYHCVASHLLEPPPLHPLKLRSEVVPAACSPANQNTLTKQPCSPRLCLHCTYSAATIRLQRVKYLLNRNPVSFSHCRLQALTSLRTPLPSHRKNHQSTPLMFPRYIPEWWVLYVPAESDRQTDSPLQTSPLMP